MSKLKAMLATLLVVGAVSAPMPAQAQDIDALVDLLVCEVYANPPSVGGGVVVGSGGVSGCTIISNYPAVAVCLDYNGVTLAHTCRNYKRGGPTGPALCLPGVWMTQVTVPGLGRIHSEPVIVTGLEDGCIIR